MTNATNNADRLPEDIDFLVDVTVLDADGEAMDLVVPVTNDNEGSARAVAVRTTAARLGVSMDEVFVNRITQTTNNVTARLVDVEDGFARVVNAATGKTMGYVFREKFGSTRTGTRWVATRTRRDAVPMGHGDTRAAAVRVLADHASKFAR
jgi:hypothetical protein